MGILAEMFAGSLSSDGGMLSSALLPPVERERYAKEASEARRERYASSGVWTEAPGKAPKADKPKSPTGSQSSADGRWITINGNSGEDGDGGTRIRIDDDGNITAGPKALKHAGITHLSHFGKKGKSKPKAKKKAEKKPKAAKPVAPKPAGGMSNQDFVGATTAAAARQESATSAKALGDLAGGGDKPKPKKNPSDNLIPFLPLDRDPPEEPATAAAPREKPGTNLQHWREALSRLEPAQRKTLMQRFSDWWSSLMKEPDTTEYAPGFLGALQRVAAKSFHSKDAAERERYQKDPGDTDVMRYAERWITLNGDSGDDGNGGTPVKIDDDGDIVAGPKGLADKGVTNLEHLGMRRRRGRRS